MRLSSFVTVGVTFLGAAILCIVAAGFSATIVEDSSRDGVRRALADNGLIWADADANGLQLFLIGTAPSEAERFKAVATAGTIVDAARVIDQMDVAAREDFAPPRFSIEILRNDSGISLIGLVPDTAASQQIREEIADLAQDGTVSDLLEMTQYMAPEGWSEALMLGMDALERLPRSKISIDAQSVFVSAMADSEEVKRQVETELRRRAPEGIELTTEIMTPRPVISPFSLRFLIDEQGPRFDACSADTAQTQEQIIAAARAAGLQEPTHCPLGLGVPSREWGKAAALAISKLHDLGGGSITFSNADITLIAKEGTDPGTFDRIVGELETGLPEVFALQSVLPVAEDTNREPAEFTATLSPEGQVQLRGRVATELARSTADSFAKARFGSGSVYMAARLDEELPRDWSVRVLAGIEALSLLANGSVRVGEAQVRVFGETGDPEAKAQITSLFSEKLGDRSDFSIEVTYREKLDPIAGLPTPEECIASVAKVQESRKIVFEPGSGELDESAVGIMNEIAEILKACPEGLKMQIGGHTDSQGREIMNQQLSQARAQSVLNALRDRQVLTSSFSVKGFGEEKPIADNATAEGREANRRIEFTLILPEPTQEQETTLEALSEEAKEQSDAETSQDTGAEGDTSEQN